jgi:hypothetical protein
MGAHQTKPGLSSGQDIGVEANPYYYKLPPGYYREAFGPLYLALLVELSRLDAHNLLTDEDRLRIETIRQKLQALVDGGIAGKPRKKMRTPPCTVTQLPSGPLCQCSENKDTRAKKRPQHVLAPPFVLHEVQPSSR